MASPGIFGFLYSQYFVKPPIPSSDLTGQTLIITGSNVGLGFEAARHIARLRPSRLILAVRTLSKGESARSQILGDDRVDSSKTDISVWQLDMSNFKSCLSFADRCDKELDRIDGVSLNAGIQMTRYEANEGFESTIAVNVVSTFLLTMLLLPTLQRSARKHGIIPCLSIVGSETHAWAPFKEKSTPPGQSILKVMSDPKVPVTQARYMDSKLMQLLIFRHLHNRIESTSRMGTCKVTMNTVTPGFCYSTLGRDGSRAKDAARWLIARSQEMGGRPVAAGLLAGPETDGMYLRDGLYVPDKAENSLSAYVRSAEGEATGKRLWQECREVFEGVRPGICEEL